MLKKMKTFLIVILLSLTFSACSNKEVVIEYKVKYKCIEQSIYPQPKLNIYIAKEDLENAKEYKKIKDKAFNLYEKQVIKNNKLCKKLINEERVE